MTSFPTVLFFTYPEHGQANVILATSYELALAGVNVCVASFSSLEPRISGLQELIVRHCNASSSNRRPTGSVSFRECKGFPSFLEIMARNGLNLLADLHPPGVSGALKSFLSLDIALFPWEPQEHQTAIGKIQEIITTVQPDVVVIDTFFYIAMDACKLAGQKFMIILPNSLKDITAGLQPYFAGLWKYPVLASGFQFPLQWWQIPLNIYLGLRLMIQLMSSQRVKRIQAFRRSLGIKPAAPLEFHPGVTHICAALPETDFPLAIIPEEVVPCGPIIVPFDPLGKSDPELTKWLDNGPTVLVNLGTHALADEAIAREMAGAFRILLDYHEGKEGGKIQILWKVKPSGDIQQVIDVVIGKEIREGKIKVVVWLEAEPVSILQHPNVVCTVHHGGANSYNEGVWSGMPHIVLPVWLDTFEYANRVEFLNIGVIGNKRKAPGVGAEELGNALVKVTGNSDEARTFRLAAQRLKIVCRTKGAGRQLASAIILKELGTPTTWETKC